MNDRNDDQSFIEVLVLFWQGNVYAPENGEKRVWWYACKTLNRLNKTGNDRVFPIDQLRRSAG